MRQTSHAHGAATQQKDDPGVKEAASKRKDGWVAFWLGCFQLVVGISACLIIVAVILHIPVSAALNDTRPEPALDIMGRALVVTVAGATLGASLHSLVGLHLHAAVLKNFERRYIGSYIIGPFAAALLGLALFAVIQSGLLALAGDGSSTSSGIESRRAAFFYVALGVLTGFAFDTAVIRLDGVARQIFGDKQGSLLASALQRSKQHEKQPSSGSQVNSPRASRTQGVDSEPKVES